MRRRDFLGAALVQAGALATAHSASRFGLGNFVPAAAAPLKPMAVGVLIVPAKGPEATISRVKELGMTNCFLSLDAYIGKFTPALADELGGLLQKYGVTATTAEVVGPGKLVWNFEDGPSTIGLVPRDSRAARIDALKQTSDFAKLLGIPQIQTHCGFIPENPRDPLYDEAVLAIQEVAKHCAANGQHFLMETGQETPTTMARAIKDVNQPNLGVGLDTANVILYGKANPVDAVDIIGPHVRAVHAKDGKWPTNPMKLGDEVLIGTGIVDFEKVFTKLHKLGYSGTITIERETEGPQQMEDVKNEKVYLERIIEKIQKSNA
ncbi:sugar phosphate isomerase/epimerase [Acidobacterium sp. S8]|uniref:sugar phosphate isomerase/epimerase family protein n=1 Tax=Acidobacterium sp. S8 TaxID=1641854 RepID=UPI00131C7F8A|nr:sugar phosphate isomerase/epimerase family protein [Acidobacterium sp. S8]